MAIVENRSTEIGDVMRIQTDIPIVGLISLTSFLDDTEGEQSGSTSGVLPQYLDEGGNRVTYSRVAQIGEERFCWLSGIGIASQNVYTGVWDLNYPQPPENVQSFSSDGSVLYVVSNPYDPSTEQYRFLVTKIDLVTRALIGTFETTENVGSISFYVTAEVYDNKIYWWSRVRGGEWSLWTYNVINNLVIKIGEYFEPITQPTAPAIDVANGKIYYLYRVDHVNGPSYLGVYDIVGDSYDVSLTRLSGGVGRMVYDNVNDRVYTLVSGDSTAVTKVVYYYDVLTDTWIEANSSVPDSLSFVNYLTYYDGRLYATGGQYFTDIYTISSNSWATSGGTAGRFFVKKFRYSLDGGLNFSAFEDLTEININNITVQRKDQFVIEVTYERSGSDSSGELVFNSFTVSGDYDELGYPIYDTTVFKKFFEVNDPNVLGWALNVLEKVFQSGILPEYVERNRGLNIEDDKDFSSYWYSVTHMFAILVYFARQFQAIPQSKALLIEFFRQFGLITDFDPTLQQLGDLFGDYKREFNKRGTEEIKYLQVLDEGEEDPEIGINLHLVRKGTVDGELRRLINYISNDEFIFELLEAHKVGWCIGESSPTWTATQGAVNLIKAFEFTDSVEDLSKYPLINSSNISVVYDSSIEKNVMRITGTSGNVGIGFDDFADPDKDFLIRIDPALDYSISFKVKKLTDDVEDLRFEVYGYDENLNLTDLFTVTAPSVIATSLKTQEDAESLYLADQYYSFDSIIYNSSFPDTDDLFFNYLHGRGLRTSSSVKYIGVGIYSQRNVSSADLNIYDIKVRPRDLPFSQGIFGIKNVILGYLKNRGEKSDAKLEEFIQNFLIPYNSFIKLKTL